MPLRGLFSTSQPGQQHISGSLLVGLGCPYQSGKQPRSCPLVFLTDVDECTDADACGEARCKNLLGSYSCLCDEGYEFISQEKACRGTRPQLPWAPHTYTYTHARHTCEHVHSVHASARATHHTCAHHTHMCINVLLDATGHLLQPATDTEKRFNEEMLLWQTRSSLQPQLNLLYLGTGL